MSQSKREYEELQKNFLLTLQKRSKEFAVVRMIFGLYHLDVVLERKEALVRA